MLKKTVIAMIAGACLGVGTANADEQCYVDPELCLALAPTQTLAPTTKQTTTIQTTMQTESRVFATISNALKTKQDATENSISNVR